MQQAATRWFSLRRNLREQYSPLFFLAALGNGGTAITFFIWLNFLIPHPRTPIVTFDSIAAFLNKADTLAYALTIGAMAGIVIFALRHLRLIVWNVREYAQYRRTPAYSALRETNGAISLMGMPLTLAMTVNVFFVLGAVFVPGLWNVVEYLFPISLSVLTIIGVAALRIFLDLFGRALAGGHFDCTRNNNLSQLQAAFTFAMVAVGLAAPAAMSGNRVTIAVSILLAIFFLSAAALVGVIMLVLGFRGMLAHGLAVEAGPSLWMPIPILTLMGIAMIRIRHGLHHGFEVHIEPGSTFVLIGSILALQLLTGVIGYAVLRRVGYLRTYLWGEARSPGSYGLICPAVALFVFGMFFVHPGLVQNGLIEKYSLTHYLMMAPLALVQALGIIAMLRLDGKLLRPQFEAPSSEMATA
ncbi:MAG: hypothetical protein RMK84_01930 [Oscillochloridaceae bacterium]|nr:hypothetical protein [Chloroflexaceae bacterium]MDW8388861.1 hypothetical protein [Oscillochloridaceae bacterium]